MQYDDVRNGKTKNYGELFLFCRTDLPCSFLPVTVSLLFVLFLRNKVVKLFTNHLWQMNVALDFN